MNEFSPEQPQAARQFSSSCAESHAAQREESGLSIEPTSAESRQSTMPTDATDRLAIGEIGADAPAGQHTNEQAGSHDCDLVVAPTGQGITASLEARAGRTPLPAESIFVNVMNANLKQSLTPGEEEVQKPASAPSVQPQSSNGCTPEVASGSPVSTLSNTSENKPEGVNLPAAAEGEPSAEAEFGSSAATNSNQSKAMKANQIEKVSSVQAEEDAQVNTCEQTVQPSVEINACAASPGETEQIASPQAEPPSSVSTDSTNSDAAAIASANLNSGTDFVATTNTNTVMNTTSNTNNVVAPTSEGVSPDFTFTQSEVSPIGFNRTTFTEPQKPGSDWDTVYSGVCVDLMNQAAVTNQLVLKGDKLVLTRPTQLSVCMTVDDHGDLLISNTELADDAIQSAFDAAPKLSSNEAIITAFSGSLCFHMDLQGTEWQYFDSGASAWKRLVRTLVLPAGDYFIYGRVTNDPMKGGNANNRKLFRYAIQAKKVKEHKIYRGAIRKVCSNCTCGETEDGDADKPSRVQTPGWEGEPCPSFVTYNKENNRVVYDSPWLWEASILDDVIVITPPIGEPLYFSIPAEGSAEAGFSGASPARQNRVQYQDSNFNATTSNNPDYIMMKDPKGICVTFEVSTGKVYCITTEKGRRITASEQALHVIPTFDDSGNLISCESEEAKLVCTIHKNSLDCRWYRSSLARTVDVTSEDLPYKTESIRIEGNKTYLYRQQKDLPAHCIIRDENNDITTITKGEGDEAIVHRYETTYPMTGLMIRTESVYFAATPDNVASCTQSVYNYSDAGWQLYSLTEGFGSDVARSISYIYDEENRLVKVQRYDGGYTEYEYDSLGRVTMEKIPWGENLAKVTRTTYADSRFYDVRPASEAVYHVNASGTEVLFRNTEYTYEESAELERVTTTVTEGSSNQQQILIEETFGSSPAYTYAAGKTRLTQDISGLQTVHNYEGTSEYNAVHKHTIVTKVNGDLVAAQSKKQEEYIASNDTVIFETESIWDGSQWLLLDSTAYEYDEQHRIIRTSHGNGRFSITSWMCCGKLSETNEDGITTTYAYDTALQLKEISRSEVYDENVCITPECITEYTRDAEGRETSITNHTGAMTTTEYIEYDQIGRIIKQIDILGRVTTTTYSPDGLTSTVTKPSGATTITTQNTDGSPASVSGTAQRALVYVYDLNGNSLRTTTKLADGTTIAQSIVNGFGQTTVQAQASTSGFIYTRSEFNAKGKLTKQYQDTGWNTPKTAATLYEYDGFGNVVREIKALEYTPTKNNSVVKEMNFGIESNNGEIYKTYTQTHYNNENSSFSTIQKHLISKLDPSLVHKTITINERNVCSVEWAIYSAPAKITYYNSVEYLENIAESTFIDEYLIYQKDFSGNISSSSRLYTDSGLTETKKDGRNNDVTQVFDYAGRLISEIDAANNITSIVYSSVHDSPIMITNSLGYTACYKYDERGRKLAEWGTGIQPACYSFDDMDNMITMRTFRVGSEYISSDPSERIDYDQTSWSFHPATGLELSKTYPDGTSLVKTYDDYNRLATETDARGNVKIHSYDLNRGLHIGTTYITVDGTAHNSDRNFSYNHLGQLTQVSDDVGTRLYSYNSYGETETETLMVDDDIHIITENRDEYGRLIGYTYTKNGEIQQTVVTGYGTDGRISTTGFHHAGDLKQFSYEYLIGSDLLKKLSKPNGMTLTLDYEAKRDVLTNIAYHRGNTLVAQRVYTYDKRGCATARSTSRQGTVQNDTFAHNSRSELTSAQINGKEYAYNYDNVGNRLSSYKPSDSVENSTMTNYATNNVNQYTSIQNDNENEFSPQFDENGNQTLIKTTNGIWLTVYNAENRPVKFTNSDSNIIIEYTYDFMGRRSEKKVSKNDETILHHRYIYHHYNQIACCDLTRSSHTALWLITWDPLQISKPTPLAIQKDGTWYTYGLDITNNICEVFGNTGYIRNTYAYSPYGEILLKTGNVSQPLKWSSEIYDEENGLVYYNFRHLNVLSGRWINRDPLSLTKQAIKLYEYVYNNPILKRDYLGLIDIEMLSGLKPDLKPFREGEKHLNVMLGITQARVSFGLFANKEFTNNERDENGCVYNTLKVNGGIKIGLLIATFAKNLQLGEFKASVYAGVSSGVALSLALSGELFQMKNNKSCAGGRICFVGKAEHDINIGAVMEIALQRWFSIQVGGEIGIHLEAEYNACASLYKNKWKFEGNHELMLRGAIQVKVYAGIFNFTHRIATFGPKKII